MTNKIIHDSKLFGKVIEDYTPRNACSGCCFLTETGGCLKDIAPSCYNIIFKQHQTKPEVFNAATAKEIAFAANMVKEGILTKIMIAAEQGKFQLNVAGLNEDVLHSLTEEPYNFVYNKSQQTLNWN